MRPVISLITLGVANLERSLAFYRDGLGLPSAGIMGTEFEIGAVAFIDLQPGLKLALWPRSRCGTGVSFASEEISITVGPPG